MSKLTEIEQAIGLQTNPPVHLWKSNKVGEIEIRIDAQGFWFHQGDPIARDALVKLFASILWFEDNQYYLVTPVEKLKIIVADVPFIVQQMQRVEKTWIAVTNTHEQIIIGQDNPVELRQYHQQWIPYVQIRYDLWARVNRSIYYQWVSEAIELQSNETAPLILASQGYQFEVARV
ncbi:DUF1285 domain-containing protein [Arenicella sp.]|nr:DUF1285 domain-containing protein [Arenicella sp.]